MSAHAAAVLAALFVVFAGSTTGGPFFESYATEPYGLALSGNVSVHTPPEVVTLAGTAVEVDSTTPHSGYEPITVTVTAPTDDARLELFDTNGDRRTTVDPSGADTATIPTDTLSSGTYYLAVRSEGEIRAVERLVVSRHDITFSVVESASTAEELAFRIGVIPGGDVPYRAVEVVVTDGDADVVTTASEVRLGLYETAVDRTALPPGEYAVYARLVGRPGPYIGMSEALTVTVEGEPARQSATTETATGVATEAPVSPTDDAETTATQFPETGVALLLLTLVVVGLTRRLRPRC